MRKRHRLCALFMSNFPQRTALIRRQYDPSLPEPGRNQTDRPHVPANRIALHLICRKLLLRDLFTFSRMEIRFPKRNTPGHLLIRHPDIMQQRRPHHILLIDPHPVLFQPGTDPQCILHRLFTVCCNTGPVMMPDELRLFKPVRAEDILLPFRAFPFLINGLLHSCIIICLSV